MSIYDALWDKRFEDSQELLDSQADEAHAEYLAGETEDFDPDVEKLIYWFAAFFRSLR